MTTVILLISCITFVLSLMFLISINALVTNNNTNSMSSSGITKKKKSGTKQQNGSSSISQAVKGSQKSVKKIRVQVDVENDRNWRHRAAEEEEHEDNDVESSRSYSLPSINGSTPPRTTTPSSDSAEDNHPPTAHHSQEAHNIAGTSRCSNQNIFTFLPSSHQSLISGSTISTAHSTNSSSSAWTFQTALSRSFNDDDSEYWYSAASTLNGHDHDNRLERFLSSDTLTDEYETKSVQFELTRSSEHEKLPAMSRSQTFPSLNLTNSLSVSSCYSPGQQRPGTSRNLKGKRNLYHRIETGNSIEDTEILPIDVPHDYDRISIHSLPDPNIQCLYKSTNVTKYPDILLNLTDDDIDDLIAIEEASHSHHHHRPILSPSELCSLNNGVEIPQEIEVFVEIENDPEQQNEINQRRRTRTGVSTAASRKSYGRDSISSRTSVLDTEDVRLRTESIRKLSQISRVLLVNEDNKYEDLLHIEIDALERRFSRDNFQAIKLLDLIGDEISLDSGESTPLGFQFSDNVLKIRFLISWKAALAETKHKKSQIQTEIPLAATKHYKRPISKWRRCFRILRQYCVRCLRVFKCLPKQTKSSDERDYDEELVKSVSVEAFQQEIDVMESTHGLKRMTAKREIILGSTDSLKELNKIMHSGKDHDKKHDYRDALELDN